MTMTYDVHNKRGHIETTQAVGTSTAKIPPPHQRSTVTIHPDPTGTGKAQYTTSSPALLAAGTARWVDWEDGSVSAVTTRTLSGPVTGWRFVCSSGQIVGEIVTA